MATIAKTYTEYECAQCHAVLMVPPVPMHALWEDESGRVFCSTPCLEEWEMRQGELQTERRLS